MFEQIKVYEIIHNNIIYVNYSIQISISYIKCIDYYIHILKYVY